MIAIWQGAVHILLFYYDPVFAVKPPQSLIMFAGLCMFAVINSKHESYRSYQWHAKRQYAYFF
jgi:hypothetical protein